MKEFYVYSWTTFFSDMGSYIGLLLGWSFLSVLEMVIDFLDILIRKKLTVQELTNNELQNGQNWNGSDIISFNGDQGSIRAVSAVSSMLSVETEYAA